MFTPVGHLTCHSVSQDLVAIPVDREEVIEGVEPQALTPGVAAPERRIDKEPTFLSDDEYVTVTWKLSFAGYTPKTIAEMDTAIDSLPGVYNMTASQSELEYLQYSNELTSECSLPTFITLCHYIYLLFPCAVALSGHRIDEDAHPHRVRFLLMTMCVLHVVWELYINDYPELISASSPGS